MEVAGGIHLPLVHLRLLECWIPLYFDKPANHKPRMFLQNALKDYGYEMTVYIFYRIQNIFPAIPLLTPTLMDSYKLDGVGFEGACNHGIQLYPGRF